LAKGKGANEAARGQSSFEMPEQQRSKMLSFIGQSISSSEEVHDDFLKWLHSDLPHQYRNNFIRGMQLDLEGLKEIT